MTSTARLFTRATTERLLGEYLPRLELAVGRLSREQLWWRPHEGTNSVGNLLIHLEGNVRQWIISGIGGAPDHRDRASEFDARGRDGGRGDSAPPQALSFLRETVEEACRIIQELGEPQLREARTIQGYEQTTLEAVYHVLEHFGWHTGQITWIVKEMLGPEHGISYYDDGQVNRARNP